MVSTQIIPRYSSTKLPMWGEVEMENGVVLGRVTEPFIFLMQNTVK